MEQRLDVSALEAPEPLLKAIDALETMAPGDYLRLQHRMKPCHLYSVLENNGLVSDTRRGEAVECEVFIWRQGDKLAEAMASLAASELPLWEE